MTIYSRTIRPHPVAPRAIPLTEFPGAGYGSYTFQSTPGAQWGCTSTWRTARAFAERWQRDFDLPYVDVAFYPPLSRKSPLVDRRLTNSYGHPRPYRTLDGQGGRQEQYEAFLSWFAPYRVGASFMTEQRGWVEVHCARTGVPLGRKEFRASGTRYYVNGELWKSLQRARRLLKEKGDV